MLNYNFKYLLKNSYLTDHSVFVTLNYSKFFLGIRSSFIIFDFNFFFFTFKRVKFFLENLILNYGNIFSLSNAEGSRQDLIFFNSFFFFFRKTF